ncbi:PTS sugar transporter subunit IIA [Tuwongella immobilis]|uniref:PTS EIIA type-2 domain-containing protein n=1 Tax=Tuwongella immobilis TaxID=692036 RepID=A0A6C2YWC5_9BACT|nr:PTS sugar transporter subunit IIA [Tuwongella immobilis]VIP05249.1 pts fructose-specific iiabc component : Probable PTS system, fructose-specific IIABC component OS=Planctomyces maris DSM 8797 GN=PM8797T_18139 PE=4 SV=1: HTH_17: PTS_EIIA_2 [Tuwongella immobilis]VTS07854.1 pts fructose-specific iiabc component : Probable PTS system, fructose-specific IIABC component OS=Planctomyces maris DSM 8797 GN=PM8797T_18139 PE=4 SV=1: HTH_17: PTS_EIIA_2 [Tuwongella immobilis]
MLAESMDLKELSRYLGRDPRDVQKLVNKGEIPARRVGGEWRFSSAEVHQWLEQRLRGFEDEHLAALDVPNTLELSEPLLTNLLPERCIAVPLPATTRSSVLREMVKLADQSWNVFDSDQLLEAVQAREEAGSTGHPGGIAVPHPRRPLPDLLGDHVLAVARIDSGIPFGASDRGMTDIFFLVACRDYRTHLRILARIARLERLPEFLDSIRNSETPRELLETITTFEQKLLESPDEE